MSASLLLGPLDLMSAPYSTHVGSSFGGWQAVTTSTSSLFTDGSVVSGEASSNREIRLLVQVSGATHADIVAASEALLAEANKQSNTLTWTMPAGPQVVYDVFRVQSPTRTDDESEAWTFREYELTFPAMPFARSAVKESPSALSPAVTISNFEGTFNGLALGSYAQGTTFQFVVPVKANTATLDFQDTQTYEADTNCTVTTAQQITVPTASGGSQVVSVDKIVPTAAGDAIARTTSTWPITAGVDVVSVGSAFTKDGTFAQQTVGVEFLDGTGVSLGTTWGTPSVASQDNGGTYSVWCAAPVPTNAASYRIRARIAGATAGKAYYVDPRGSVGAQASLGDADRRATSIAHDGTKGMFAVSNLTQSQEPLVGGQLASFIYEVLAAAVDISAQDQLGFWFNPQVDLSRSSSYVTVSMRLFDAAGHWSRYDFAYPGGSTVYNQWVHLSRSLSNPDEASAGGAVNLTAVTAYTLSIDNTTGSVDGIAAGVAPTGTTTPRGTVYVLDNILGSARSQAAVEVSAGVPLTDWLVAAVPADNGRPLLSVASNVATAPAPAQYDGTYSILGCVSPATALTSPTCTVAQTINGTQVASVTLTGTQRSGNRYVDFGSIALPLVAVPDENQQVAITFALAPSSTSWTEVLVLDTDASLAWVDNLATAMAYGWVDEPDPTAGLGRVWIGTASDRSDARALTNPPTLSRPLLVQAPSTRLLVYSTTTAPDITLSYYPRWLIEPPA